MKKLNSGIYSITNLVNGKKYYGRSKELDTRKENHFNKLKQNIHENIHLQKSYNKHGRGSFKFKVLDYLPEFCLIQMEQWYLDKVVKWGIDFNLSINASGGHPPLIIYEFSILGKFIKKWNSMEEACLHYNLHKTTINKALRGHNLTAGNRIWAYTKDCDLSLTLQKINRKETSHDRNNKLIYIYKNFDLLFIVKGVVEACKVTFNYHSAITRSIKYKGYSKGYLYSDTKLTKEQIKLRYIQKTKKPVIKYDLNKNFIKQYASIKEASEDSNCTPTTIRNIINNKIKNPKNYIWEYKL